MRSLHGVAINADLSFQLRTEVESLKAIHREKVSSLSRLNEIQARKISSLEEKLNQKQNDNAGRDDSICNLGLDLMVSVGEEIHYH